MAFDPSALLDISHLVTFLGGAAVGAAGTYVADRLTDQRRKAEAKAAAKAEFKRLSGLMPELFDELRQDLKTNKLLRELVILSSDRLTFNHDKPRIEIHENKHPQAKNQLGILVSSGQVAVVRATDVPIYKMEEHFVQSLERDA